MKKKSVYYLMIDDSNSGLIVSDIELSNDCIRLDEHNGTCVIRNQIEYDSLINPSTCEKGALKTIDFEKYSLLGFRVSGACEIAFDRNVSSDEANKKYVYNITLAECGTCEKLEWSMNWVLVPVLPSEWTVDFMQN